MNRSGCCIAGLEAGNVARSLFHIHKLQWRLVPEKLLNSGYISEVEPTDLPVEWI